MTAAELYPDASPAELRSKADALQREAVRRFELFEITAPQADEIRGWAQELRDRANAGRPRP